MKSIFFILFPLLFFLEGYAQVGEMKTRIEFTPSFLDKNKSNENSLSIKVYFYQNSSPRPLRFRYTLEISNSKTGLGYPEFHSGLGKAFQDEELLIKENTFFASEKDSFLVVVKIFDVTDKVLSLKKSKFVFETPKSEDLVISKDSRNSGDENLGGLLLDQTKTKLGKDFFYLFYSYFKPPAENNSYLLTVREQLSQIGGRNTRVQITLNDVVIFQRFLSPRTDLIKDAAIVALDRVHNILNSGANVSREIDESSINGTDVF
jgi:hypothetical protein